MANSAVPHAVGPASFWVNFSRALRHQVRREDRHGTLCKVDAFGELVREDDDPLLDTLNAKIPALPRVTPNWPLAYLKQSDLKESWG